MADRMATQRSKLDGRRVEALARELTQRLIPELAAPPPAADNALVCLNALAFGVATVLAGSHEVGAQRARQFFNQALNQNLGELKRAVGAGALKPPGCAEH